MTWHLHSVDRTKSVARLSPLAGSLTLATVVIGAAGALAARDSAAPGSQPSVTLNEMSIVRKAVSVKRGPVTFIVRNAGTVEHELVVVPTTSLWQ